MNDLGSTTPNTPLTCGMKNAEPQMSSTLCPSSDAQMRKTSGTISTSSKRGSY